jgi:pimeloyl-ACP methyl ester carboxylesterase
MNATPAPVVFIPALLCDEAMYRDVITNLGGAIGAQVMLSPQPDLADSVADILSRAPETFMLVGTSYGGSLALEIALAAPRRVTALWLMGCNAAPPQAGGADLAASIDTDPNRVIERLAGLVVHKDATAAAATYREMAHRVGGPAGAAQARAAATRKGSIERLATLGMPTLLVWGADDALSPLSCGQALAQGIPHAHLEVLEGCGHLPTLEKPAQCATLFRALLLQTAAGPPLE